MAALAVVIMSLGTLIPVATYVCPMLCTLLTQVVYRLCGGRIAWAWYGAVGFLSVLLAPDKEAAGMFLALGYYPIVKPRLDRSRGKWLWKLLLFNGATGTVYFVMMKVLGMTEISESFAGIGLVLLLVLLVMGNVTFLLLDYLLGRTVGRRK